MPHNGGRSQLNLSHMQFGGYQPFANLFLNCQQWSTISPDGSPIPTNHDANGYMHTLYNGGVYTVGRRPTNTNRPGNYVLKWTGTGTFTSVHGVTTVSGSLSSSPYVFSFNNDDDDWGFRITAVGADGSNYPHSIILCHVDDEALVDADPYAFGVKFLQRMHEAKPSTIRLMNVIGGGFQNNPWCKWSDRKPVTWYNFSNQYIPGSRYAGSTTNVGAAFSLASPGFAKVDKATILFTYNADGTDVSTLDIEGTGATPLVHWLGDFTHPIPFASRYPASGRLGSVMYDADFDAYIMNGGTTNTRDGALSLGWPVEMLVALCNEVGSHLSVTAPYASLDPMSDLVLELAEYCRDNLDAGLKCKIEGPNEQWNSIFPQYYYTRAKEILRAGTDTGATDQSYGRLIYKIADVVEDVFSLDRTKYDVICGMQTFSTPSGAPNDRLASTRWVTDNGGNTAFAAYNKVTEVDVTGYWNASHFGGAVETAAAAAYAAESDTDAKAAIVDTYMLDTSGSRFDTESLVNTKHLEHKAWVDSFAMDIELGQYEGGYSPDFVGTAEVNTFRRATKDWPGLYQQNHKNYNRFISVVGGLEPSCYRMTGENDAWGVLDPNEWVTDPPQWTSIRHFNNRLSAVQLVCLAEIDPVISGANYTGGTLTGVNGTYAAGTPSGYTYQWKRSGSSIGGATSSSYVLVSGDVGESITREEIATVNGITQPAKTSNALIGLTAPPVVAGSNSGDSANTGSYAAPLPASISAGNLLLLYYTNINSGGAPTIDTPSGWTLLGTDTNSFTRTCVFYKIASGSEGATVTVTQGTGRPTVISHKITGHDAGQAPEAVLAAGSNDPAELTPSWGLDNNLWIAGMSGDGGANATAPTFPTGYSDNQLTRTSSNSDGGKVSVGTKTTSALSDNPSAFTGAVPTSPVAFTVAVKPA